MIVAYDQNLPEAEQREDVIVYATGTIDKLVVTRVLKIAEIDETTLDELRRETYEIEGRGVQRKTGGSFYTYTSTFGGRSESISRGNAQSQRYNNRFGTDRGADSGATRGTESQVYGKVNNTTLGTVKSFMDMRKFAKNRQRC